MEAEISSEKVDVDDGPQHQDRPSEPDSLLPEQDGESHNTSGCDPGQQGSASDRQEAETPRLNQTPGVGQHTEATASPSQGVSSGGTAATGLTDSHPEGLVADAETNADQKDKEEIPVECSAAPSQTHVASPQNILPTSAEALGSPESTSNGGEENSQCYLEGDHESMHKRCCGGASADATAVTKGEEVPSPPKKKQRIAQRELYSCPYVSPEGRAMEQSGSEVHPQPTHSPEDSGKEAHSAAMPSDEAAALCGPGCMKICEDQEGTPHGDPGACPSAARPGQQRTDNPAEAPEFLDFVSDSQLNTIALTEDIMMERQPPPPECPDATDLMCGLIRELSSLNQKVMAAHRELENLHRGSKGSRSSLR